MTEQPDRMVLKGVPRTQFYQGGPRCPEDFPFPSCMRAVMEYLGDGIKCRRIPQRKAGDVGCPYAYFMGVTGAAFRLSW